MIHRVVITPGAKKDLAKVPVQVGVKLLNWVESVERSGLEDVRKVPGYHDEPLKGIRAGQRSIRLNRAYRAVYVIKNEGPEFVSVEEVNKHDY